MLITVAFLQMTSVIFLSTTAMRFWVELNSNGILCRAGRKKYPPGESTQMGMHHGNWACPTTKYRTYEGYTEALLGKVEQVICLKERKTKKHNNIRRKKLRERKIRKGGKEKTAIEKATERERERAMSEKIHKKIERQRKRT
uniref:Secreted peptide n=1 Tax=Rhipicephalus pulchellus TaxID=72859 RepID=L7M1N0_RHIPC